MALAVINRYDQAMSATRPKRTPNGPSWAYVLVCAVATLYVGCLFFGSARLQTLYSDYWTVPEAFQNGTASRAHGPWSAPLDDVFIHFDFARSAARGRPFEWSHGNGYSSGGTSLIYPFILAVGYRLGLTGLDLMEWAAIVACVCVFILLLQARRAFRGLPPWAEYLAPPALLGVGALSWALFSGMEIALFLALWAGAFAVWDRIERGRNDPPHVVLGRAALLGIARRRARRDAPRRRRDGRRARRRAPRSCLRRRGPRVVARRACAAVWLRAPRSSSARRS